MYATEVIADEVILLGGLGEGQGNGQARAAAAPSGAVKGTSSAAAVAQEEYGGIDDSDIPF